MTTFNVKKALVQAAKQQTAANRYALIKQASEAKLISKILKA